MASNSSDNPAPAHGDDALRKDSINAEAFRALYSEAPAWEIGRPQQVVVELAMAGGFRGEVLDAGCGTGENAIFLASLGHSVFGIDFLPGPVEAARQKAAQRNLAVEFLAHDALRINELGRQFDTVLDCGMFHVFSDADRAKYIRSLSESMRNGARLHMICFSESEAREGGPRRVRREEIASAFADGWKVIEIRPVRFEATTYPGGAQAWLATIERV